MSSQVNKSSTRFVPKVARRGPGNAPPRRLSTLRASFSASRPVFTPLANQAQEGNSQVNDQTEKPAVEDDAGSNADISMSAPGTSTIGNSRPSKARRASIVEENAIDDDDDSHLDSIQLENSRTAKIRSSRSRTLAQFLTEDAVEESPVSEAGIATSNRIPVVTEVSGEDIQARKERRRDKDGKELIEPEDLPLLGRGNRGVVSNEEKQAIENRIIDVERFTMGALCSDIPIGQMNDNFDNYETARISRKRRRARILRAKQMLRGKYQPKREEERKELYELYRDYRDEREEQFGRVKEESQANMRALDSEVASDAPSGPAIQLQRNQKGEIMVESQTFDRHRDNPAERDDLQRKEERPWDKIINSYSFSTKERPERWTAEETDRFYQALSAWGTDFNLIAHMFPTRTRHQIKTKFKYEERRNSAKVQLYLVHRRHVKIEDYEKISGKQIVEVSQMEEDLARVRSEHEQQVKLEEVLKQRALQEDCQRQMTQKPSSKRQVKREKQQSIQ